MMANYLRTQPRILLLVIAVIVVAGVTSLQVIPRLEDPPLTSRFAISTTILPGGSPQQVEALVTEPLEEALFEIPEIAKVRSNTGTNVSRVVIELKEEITEPDAVWSTIRDQLEAARQRLPSACQTAGLKVIPLKAFAAILAIESTAQTDSAAGLARLRPLAKQLRTELIRIPSTQQVNIIGDPGEQYAVSADPAKLAKHGLSSLTIAEQLREAIVQRPASSIASGSANLPVALGQQDQAIDWITNTKVASTQNPALVRLGDIASVQRRLIDRPPNMALIDGKRAIVVGAMVDPQRRVDRWADQLEITLDQFRSRLPDDAKVELLFSQADHIELRIIDLVKSLLLGTVAVTLVVWGMLGWRCMIVVAVALPMSALMVLAGMRWLSIPIHQMSVTGLIVAMGLLIDNAIVMVDSIRARQLRGDSIAAAINGSIGVFAIPLLVSTSTTAMAFMPIAMLPGASGEFVGSIAISVMLAIFSSFALSMTIVPATMGLIGVQSNSTSSIEQRMTNVYRRLLESLFRYPVVGVVLGLVLPLAGAWALTQLPEQFFPPSDRSQIQVEVEQPARDSMDATRRAVAAVSELLGESDRVGRQYWFIGESAPSFYYNVLPRRQNTPFYAQAFVDIERTENISQLVRQLQAKVDRFAGSRVIIRQLQQGPPIEAPVEIRLTGNDLKVLRRLGEQVRRMLSRIPEVASTRSDLGETIPRLSLSVDETALAKAGLDRSQISGFLYSTLEGVSAGDLFDGTEKLPIHVELADNGVPLVNRALAMPIATGTSPTNALSGAEAFQPTFETPVPLADLVKVDVDSDPGSIVRLGGKRINEIKAYVAAGILPATVITKLRSMLAAEDFDLPEGYQLTFGGESEQRREAIGQLVANGVVLCSLMVLVLVLAFQSFRTALIVALIGGLSVFIAPLSLWVFGYPLGFMAILGTMGLVGIAINDSIVVLAAINENQAATRQAGGLNYSEIVIDCTRHILATTLTTIVGFLPLILSGGAFWPPLAITISGGIAGATFLALVVTPCFHMLLHRRRQRAGRTSPGQLPAVSGAPGSA